VYSTIRTGQCFVPQKTANGIHSTEGQFLKRV
jgi:hypothetical protein